MKLLLDTHAFLWFVLNDPSLSPIARDLIIDPLNEIFLSPATHWEIAIKISIGKYQLPGPFESWINTQIQTNDFQILPIEVSHTALVTTLPFHHKDPFDRLLISQSLVEKIPIISTDGIFDSYGVSRLW
jgi:PIN domain nuclease of toxin-antitoxin system